MLHMESDPKTMVCKKVPLFFDIYFSSFLDVSLDFTVTIEVENSVLFEAICSSACLLLGFSVEMSESDPNI